MATTPTHQQLINYLLWDARCVQENYFEHKTSGTIRCSDCLSFGVGGSYQEYDFIISHRVATHLLIVTNLHECSECFQPLSDVHFVRETQCTECTDILTEQLLQVNVDNLLYSMNTLTEINIIIEYTRYDQIG